MKSATLLRLSLLPAFGLSASAAADAGILARVSDTEVKIDNIRSSLENLSPQEQAALAANPALLNQAVRSLLARRVVLNEALAQKWDQHPAFAAQFEKLRENALIESYLQSVSLPPADFPAESDLQAVFEANRAALIAPRQVRLAQIYIAAPRAADQAAQDEARARLDAVRKKLAQPGADFAALARVESDEKQSAARSPSTRCAPSSPSVSAPSAPRPTARRISPASWRKTPSPSTNSPSPRCSPPSPRPPSSRFSRPSSRQSTGPPPPCFSPIPTVPIP